jgi:hypothetical protein
MLLFHSYFHCLAFSVQAPVKLSFGSLCERSLHADFCSKAVLHCDKRSTLQTFDTEVFAKPDTCIKFEMLSGFPKLKIMQNLNFYVKFFYIAKKSMGAWESESINIYLAFKNKDMHFYDIFSFHKKVIGGIRPQPCNFNPGFCHLHISSWCTKQH